MGWLSTSLSVLLSGVPRLPARLPIWALLGPSAVSGAALAVVGGAHTPLQALVLAIIGGTIPLVANHPGWIIVPVVLVDLSLADDRVPGLGMSLRLLITLVATLLAFLVLIRQRSPLEALGEGAARTVMLPTLLFVGVSTVINLLFSDLAFVVQYLRYQVVLVTTLALVIVLIRDRRALTIAATAMLLMAVLSSVVAMGQRVGGSFALYAAVPSSVVLVFGERVFGLSGSPVTLANNLVQVAVPALGFLAVAWSDRLRLRLPLLLATASILVGVYLTTTRSALIAAGVGVVVIVALVDRQRQFALSSICVIVALVFAVALGVGLIDQRFMEGAEEDKSAASHVAIMQVAFAVALDNMVLGIGREHFEEVSRAYMSEVAVGSSGQAQRAGQGAVGTLRPHNDFLEVWSSWGMFGLATYVGVFIGALQNFLIARRSPDPLVRGMAVGGAAGLIAYGLNSAFHNYLDSSVILWCYAGLSAAVASIPVGSALRLEALRRRPLRTTIRQPASVAA
jgi:O-antigen ligase